MYGTGYIFSKSFFTGWIVVGIIWIFCSLFGVGLFPVWEGRATLAYTAKSIWYDITGRKSLALAGTRTQSGGARQAGEAGEGSSIEGAAAATDEEEVEGKVVGGEKGGEDQKSVIPVEKGD